ncbi:hypothetical protein, partial [Staphylococcus epidermidis]|uniref:hypothetical protein n=1 Tax=Staphylococcus epidermidis TaxID=1282 RepID=UPI0037D99BB6
MLFHKLTKHQLKQILTIILNKLTHPLSHQNINILVTHKPKQKIPQQPYHPQYPPTPLITPIQKTLQHNLTQ